MKRLQDHWDAHPDDRLTKSQLLEKFGGSWQAMREAMYRLRRGGTSVRGEYSYGLRRSR